MKTLNPRAKKSVCRALARLMSVLMACFPMPGTLSAGTPRPVASESALSNNLQRLLDVAGEESAGSTAVHHALPADLPSFADGADVNPLNGSIWFNPQASEEKSDGASTHPLAGSVWFDPSQSEKTASTDPLAGSVWFDPTSVADDGSKPSSNPISGSIWFNPFGDDAAGEGADVFNIPLAAIGVASGKAAGLEPSLLDTIVMRPRSQGSDDMAMSSWRGGRGVARSRSSMSPSQLITQPESEDSGTRGENDLRIDAEFIDLFGTGPGDDPAADISGVLTPPPAPQILGPFDEDDGSITLASNLDLASGATIRINGAQIGNGPYGSAGSGSGDFDFYSVSAQAGQIISIDIDTVAGLDSIIGVVSATGDLLAFNDDENSALSFDSYLLFTAPEDGIYYIAVGGYTPGYDPTIGQDPPLADPFDSSSGQGYGSEGSYDIEIGLDSIDIDYYSFDLAAGDIIGANVLGGANRIVLFDQNGVERMGSSQDFSSIYPLNSPLPGGGNASAAFVAPTDGTYSIAVLGGEGEYDLNLRVFRPYLETQTLPSTQILYLDFDGALIDTSIFGGIGPTTLSGLAEFLPGWGLDESDLDLVIDAIIARVQQVLIEDIALNGNNGDFRDSNNPGDFGLIILNSRDHGDVFGQANVSRVIVGGTIEESGVFTIGIAESIDIGNFDTEESAMVLLDLLSAPNGDPNSLNSIGLGGDATMIDLIGTAIGNIVAHEAGHFFGNWHTDQFNDFPTIMDQGGDLANTIGLGQDGIFNTGDDIDVLFGTDVFVGNEGFTGSQDTLNSIAFGLSTSASGGGEAVASTTLPPGWRRQDPGGSSGRPPIGGGDDDDDDDGGGGGGGDDDDGGGGGGGGGGDDDDGGGGGGGDDDDGGGDGGGDDDDGGGDDDDDGFPNI